MDVGAGDARETHLVRERREQARQRVVAEQVTEVGGQRAEVEIEGVDGQRDAREDELHFGLGVAGEGCEGGC